VKIETHPNPLNQPGLVAVDLHNETPNNLLPPVYPFRTQIRVDRKQPAIAPPCNL
jgi:hypothetical protein